MIRVITDSTSSIPRSLREEHGIELFSLFVNHDGKEYKESSMDLDEFYADIYEMADNIPTSSQPALSEIERVFEDAAKAGDDVLGVFLSSEDLGHVRKRRTRRERRCGETCVIPLCRRRQPYQLHGAGVAGCLCGQGGGIGHGPARMRPAVCERVRSTRFIFAPESLRFLEKGGRIGEACRRCSEMPLRISPILTVKDGVASTYAKVRTQKKAMDKMVGILKQDMEEHGLRDIAVHYIGSKQPAEEWARDVIRPLIGRDVAVVPASPVIGVHVGPAVGIAYESATGLWPTSSRPYSRSRFVGCGNRAFGRGCAVERSGCLRKRPAVDAAIDGGPCCVYAGSIAGRTAGWKDSARRCRAEPRRCSFLRIRDARQARMRP